jgi:3-oxo-5-alpha-steroid 4-dehydrogenase 1
MTIPEISRPTYDLILYIWIGIAIITFISLLRITAPYGRHTTAKWGPQINNRLGWIIMEAPVLMVLLFFVFNSMERQTTMTWIMIGLFCFHYLNRIFIFPLRLHTQGKKMPVLIVGSAVFFNLMNGFGLGYFFYAFAEYSQSWLTDPRFMIGGVLFVTGLIINWKADTVLIGLRKPNETHYVIPRSSLFNRVSCPNLAGELLEWFGYALLCWNLPAWTFFIWTAANLVPRALSHHKWYHQRFPEYPRERKAIVPYLL